MIRLTIISLLTVFTTVTHATSVWNEMQDGDVSAVEGKITDVSPPRQGQIYLTVNTKNELGEVTTKTLKVCSADNEYYRSDAERAVVLSQQRQTFEDAKKKKETIRLSYKGPWDPCVTPASR